MSSTPVIHWFRRDLRLTDNLALHAAVESGRPVIPLFILDPAILSSPRTGAPRLKFMLEALASLDDALRERGSRLIVRRGNPLVELRAVIAETGADALYVNRDYSPYARKRDITITAELSVSVHPYDDSLLLAPGTVLKDDGEPYVVYTPFWKKWQTIHKEPVSELEIQREHLYSSEALISQPIPTLAELGFDETISVPEASESRAQARLQAYAGGDLRHYSDARNALTCDPFGNPDTAGPSYLSPYFRMGLLSPRQAYWQAREAFDATKIQVARESIKTWISELAWREFYTHILYHYPHVAHGNFREKYDALEWREDREQLMAWQEGQTGYPIVDAAMRQLRAIGWMPNRARMIVSSFLTKHLLINWRSGELHFMQWLLDGDIAANNGGWQWAAGTGTDAQPYFRIFNPESQSEKFDPDGEYIRHWLPELRHVPDKFLHAPHKMPAPPANYPPPIVDHKQARERTLAAFKAIL